MAWRIRPAEKLSLVLRFTGTGRGGEIPISPQIVWVKSMSIHTSKGSLGREEGMATKMETEGEQAITVKEMNFKWPSEPAYTLSNISLNLPKSCRLVSP